MSSFSSKCFLHRYCLPALVSGLWSPVVSSRITVCQFSMLVLSYGSTFLQWLLSCSSCWKVIRGKGHVCTRSQSIVFLLMKVTLNRKEKSLPGKSGRASQAAHWHWSTYPIIKNTRVYMVLSWVDSLLPGPTGRESAYEQHGGPAAASGNELPV